MNFVEQNVSLEKCPALVLNADYRPLSYYPLSLWSWQDSIKSVFLDRVTIVSNYDRVIRSPSFNMKLPSVIALKNFIRPQPNPNFTRFNVFLRDKFSCQYCGDRNELTFDHLLPRSLGGKTAKFPNGTIYFGSLWVLCLGLCLIHFHKMPLKISPTTRSASHSELCCSSNPSN